MSAYSWSKRAIEFVVATGVFLLSGACFAQNSQDDTVRSVLAGFEITKPPAWRFLVVPDDEGTLTEVKLDDEELQKRSGRPLVVMTKYAEPYDDLNPSLKVEVMPASRFQGAEPRRILTLMAAQQRNALKDFAIAQAPREMTLSGLRAFFMRTSYLLEAGGRQFPTTSEIWLVPRGRHVFIITADTGQDEATGSRAEMQSIVRTVAIKR